MSRSKRHTPIWGMTSSESEKKDKRLARRKLRAALRRVTLEDQVLPTLREVSEVWTFDKDGKHYFGHCKDDPDFNKWMRK
jgi:hypothetical protein